MVSRYAEVPALSQTWFTFSDEGVHYRAGCGYETLAAHTVSLGLRTQELRTEPGTQYFSKLGNALRTSAAMRWSCPAASSIVGAISFVLSETHVEIYYQVRGKFERSVASDAVRGIKR